MNTTEEHFSFRATIFSRIGVRVERENGTLRVNDIRARYKDVRVQR